MLKDNRYRQGFTLLELMVTIAVLGVLIGLAAPSYYRFLERQKVRSALNEWKSSFYYAQSEALRLKDNVIFCSADTGGKKCSESNDFANGWLVLHENGNGIDVLQDVVISDKNLSIDLNLTGAQGKLMFLGNGRLRNTNAGASLVIKNKVHTSILSISSGGRLRESSNEKI